MYNGYRVYSEYGRNCTESLYKSCKTSPLYETISQQEKCLVFLRSRLVGCFFFLAQLLCTDGESLTFTRNSLHAL